eukprot:m.213606 g.213606  ORF g.213606 m.213606 type:complete len:654 (+) comp15864_c0_seq1:86-2047(+)
MKSSLKFGFYGYDLLTIVFYCVSFLTAADPSMWPPARNPPQTGTQTAAINPCNFKYTDASAKNQSDIDRAILIYTNIMFIDVPADVCAHPQPQVALNELRIQVENGTRAISLNTDESFSLDIPVPTSTTKQILLRAKTYVGVLRGLESLSQLISVNRTNATHSNTFISNCPIVMEDLPNFKYRGVLLDPARTFLSLDSLKNTIDGLLWSKMNVLHLHLTDSQSISLQLPSAPEISSNGAYSQSQMYSVENISDLVDYATDRGVIIIPELDTPGHARAWGLSNKYSSITACSEVPGNLWNKYCAEPPCGQLNPARNLTYTAMERAFADVDRIFPSDILHLGYDEVNFACWEDDLIVKQYLENNKLSSVQLLAEFFGKQKSILNSAAPDNAHMYWFGEKFPAASGLRMKSSDIVQVWEKNKDLLVSFLKSSPVSVVVSSAEHYYLDCGLGNMFGDKSWCDPFKTAWDMYSADPLSGLTEFPDRVLGGESCAWGELINDDSLSTVLWPRAAAYGGRLWAYGTPLNNTQAMLAIDAHSARLRKRGLRTRQPTTYFCSKHPELCFGASATQNGPESAKMWQEPGFISGVASGAAVMAVALVVIGIACYRKGRRGYLKMEKESVIRRPSVTKKRTNQWNDDPRNALASGGVVWEQPHRP